MTDRTKAMDELIAGDADLYDVPVDSCFTPENISDAQWLVANMPGIRRFHNMPTYERAMICHTAARFRAIASARIKGDKGRENPAERPQPVAWLHHHSSLSITPVHRTPLTPEQIEKGWTQTPLYAAPLETPAANSNSTDAVIWPTASAPPSLPRRTPSKTNYPVISDPVVSNKPRPGHLPGRGFLWSLSHDT